MRRGVAADGRNLYPAMPYPSYAKMTAEDMQAVAAKLQMRMHDAVFGGIGQWWHIRVGWHFAKRRLVHDVTLKYLRVKCHRFGAVAVEIQIRGNVHAKTSQ